jgi:hypothetical protein
MASERRTEEDFVAEMAARQSAAKDAAALDFSPLRELLDGLRRAELKFRINRKTLRVRWKDQTGVRRHLDPKLSPDAREALLKDPELFQTVTADPTRQKRTNPNRSADEITHEKTERSADEIAREETELKAKLSEWADNLAEKVIEVVKEDSALPFLEGDNDDDEQLGPFDLTGEYDPIVEAASGSRLSDSIKQAVEKFRKFRQSEQALRRLYVIALKRKWKEQPQQTHKELNGATYGRSYMASRHGVWVRIGVAGLEEPHIWRRIAKTRIDLEAMSYDTTPQCNWQHRYLITGETGQFFVDIDAEHTGKDANPAIKILMRRGVHVVESREARKHIAKFLQRRPRKRIVRAPRTGWFEWPRGSWVFVLPDEVLGATDKVRIILDGVTGDSGYGFRRGRSVGEWGTHVAVPLAHNSNVVLAVGTMLAAPLLHWADEPGGGFHFYGFSKAGKTLVMAIGQSVWGRPFIPGSGDANAFGYDWDSTSARIEERAVLRNDVGLSLDGIEGGNANAVASAIYTLASGQGRGRMRQREASFNLMLLSTGEVSIAQFLNEVRAGQMVRLSDIPAEVAPGTAFETFRPDAAGQPGGS